MSNEEAIVKRVRDAEKELNDALAQAQRELHCKIVLQTSDITSMSDFGQRFSYEFELWKEL